VSDVVETEKKGGWLSRLRAGLAKSTKRVTESITGLFTKKKLDQETRRRWRSIPRASRTSCWSWA
jgi:hypothetical protein